MKTAWADVEPHLRCSRLPHRGRCLMLLDCFRCKIRSRSTPLVCNDDAFNSEILVTCRHAMQRARLDDATAIARRPSCPSCRQSGMRGVSWSCWTSACCHWKASTYWCARLKRPSMPSDRWLCAAPPPSAAPPPWPWPRGWSNAAPARSMSQRSPQRTTCRRQPTTSCRGAVCTKQQGLLAVSVLDAARTAAGTSACRDYVCTSYDARLSFVSCCVVPYISEAVAAIAQPSSHAKNHRAERYDSRDGPKTRGCNTRGQAW